MVGNANILIRKSAFRCDSGGNQTAICGTLNGNKTKFRCQEADMHIVLSGPREATIIGSLVGESDIVISHAGLYIDEEGEKALVFGGFTEDSNIVLDHVNFNAVVETEMGRETMAPKDNIRITSGAWKMKFNEK